mmetsp:Transcript_9145/g.11923  ORF Transcript_9145/g.11923 Transcript_9145/m.11923 type:complete len:219 (-) Transcript_9145:806-1462(-)
MPQPRSRGAGSAIDGIPASQRHGIIRIQRICLPGNLGGAIVFDAVADALVMGRKPGAFQRAGRIGNRNGEHRTIRFLVDRFGLCLERHAAIKRAIVHQIGTARQSPGTKADQGKGFCHAQHPQHPRPYSAAMAPMRPDFCALMRSSISSRKLRIRPWIGQAAASPSAQMVWPSTCLVTSQSMSISSSSASPFTRRSITRIIQPVPSRHGVHWPQLSCL